MTSFARTPEGRAAAERMMREYGHTNIGGAPRPGFPGRPGGIFGRNPPLNTVGVMPRQDLGQGTPTSANPIPMPQQPVGRGGRGTAPATPPSFASQMRGMGLAGMGLQNYFGNKPAGMKKGGTVYKTDMKKAGFYDKGKTKSERQKIVSKVTTKPQRIAMVEKAFSTKNMKSGGSVSSASKRADGCAIKGKTRCKIV
jgi:hypothetical protein